MQYLRGWTAFRNDPQGTPKLLWASLSGMCIPIVGQLILRGWTSLMLRRAVSGQDAPLPRMEFDIDYLMKLLPLGFKPFLAQVLWSIPFVAILMGSYCCMYLGLIGIIGGAAAGAEAGGEAGAGIGLVLGAALMIAGFVFVIVLVTVASMVMQIAVMRAELTDDLNAALRFGDVMNMTKMLKKELFISMLVLQLLGFGLVFVTIFTLYLGLFPGVVMLQIIVTYMRAELYRVYLEKGGQPLPIGPLAVEGGDPPTVGGNQNAYVVPAQF